MQAIFALGEVYAALILAVAAPELEHFKWRHVVLACVPPVVVFLLSSWRFLIESPEYLATQLRGDAASEILDVMATQNFAPRVKASLRAAEYGTANMSAAERMKAVFAPGMQYTTLTVLFSCFNVNLTFYGMLYGLPQVVANEQTGMPPAYGLLVSALWEVAGNFLGFVCCTLWRRIPSLFVGCAWTSLASAGLACAVQFQTSWVAPYVLQASISSLKLSNAVLFVAAYQYASEIYPVFARTTGSAVCISGGRLGCILAPTLFQLLVERTGSYSPFFLCACVSCAANAVLVALLPVETASPGWDKIAEEHTASLQAI
jgi:hypothetical protein